MPIQQMLLGASSAVAKKTYVDDVFSTQVYTGSGSARSINSGVDLTEGGLAWFKPRNESWNHAFIDSETGLSKFLQLPTTSGTANDTTALTSFNNNGFTLGADSNYGITNNNNTEYASWTFRKAPGFFDIVTYTGAGGTQTVNHNLGCVPGCIIIKRTDSTGNSWKVYHRGTDNSSPQNYALTLNSTAAREDYTYWNDTAPTATQFTVADSDVNGNGGTFVAYVFAGGESTAATARSVDFDGTGDYLEIPNSSDFSFGSGDFTVEGWFNLDSTSSSQTIIGVWDYENSQRSWNIEANNSGGLAFLASPNGSSSTDTVGSNCVYPGQWTHFAAVRNGNTLRLFVNGTQVATNSFTGSLYDNTNDKCYIGILNGAANITNGKISNIRVVKGTAVYTSSFKPPTAPLTNITNTKLLCCNNSSTTGSTVTPGTITANGDPTASTDSPFDDPAAFTFGEAGDQGIIKCGSYVGNGSNDGPEIFVGWEPQWLLVKHTGTDHWQIIDVMRGMANGSADGRLRADVNSAETNSIDYWSPTPTGLKIRFASGEVNSNNVTYIYMCIRRPDGYVGKPPELGTGVFAMDTAASSYPKYSAGFAPDWVFSRRPAVAESWKTMTRLTGTGKAFLNTTAAWGTDNGIVWDNNTHFKGGGGDDANTYKAWMWRRHAGFDVVTWEGTNGNVFRRHNLGRTPEMIIFKNRDAARSWRVYHKGLNGGTNPEDYEITLNGNSAEGSNTSYMNGTAPTSTHFVSGNDGDTNGYGDSYIALLFASVDGISKCGFYDGSNSAQTISTGFAPRFLIMKKVDTAQGWVVLDTVRGWGSGDDERLEFHNNSAQNDSIDFGAPTSSGFTLVGNVEKSNQSGGSYIYYAHA